MATRITKENAVEEIGRMSDKVDNLLGAMQLPVSPEIHMEGLRGNLEQMRADLREIYTSLTGENPWEE